MQLSPNFTRFSMALVLVLGGILLGAFGVQALNRVAAPAALGTGFSYQGLLRDSSNNPITNTCQLTFDLYDADSGGTQIGSSHTLSGVNVSDGLFTVTLNDSNQFGDQAFNGQPRWLEISVQCTGDPSATVLGRQAINPVPYALFAERFAGYQNIIIVAQSNGDFDSVAEAVNAIGVDPRYPAAGALNRYLIYIAPGIYADDRVVMQPYVDLEGSGEGLTFIRYPAVSPSQDANAAVLVTAANSHVRYLSVVNNHAAASGYATAIYANTGNLFRLSHVTASTTAGERSRALVMRGINTYLIGNHLTLYATGGAISTIALDVEDGGGQLDRFSAFVTGSPNLNSAIYLSGASDFKFTHGQIRLNGSANSDYGVLAFNTNDIVMESLHLDQNNIFGLMYGFYFEGSSEIILRNSQVWLGGSASFIYGWNAFNTEFELDGVEFLLHNASIIQGINSFVNIPGQQTDIVIKRTTLTITNTAGSIRGISFFSTDPTSFTFADVYDTQIEIVSSASDSNRTAVEQDGPGLFTYNNLTINMDAGFNTGSSYGMHLKQGAAHLYSVNLNANATGDFPLYGIYAVNTAQVFAIDTKVLVWHFNILENAIGVLIDNGFNHVLRNVTVIASANNDVYGFWLEQGTFQTTNLSAHVENTNNGGLAYGLYCGGGGVDSAFVTLDAAQLTAVASDETGYAFGIYGPGCKLTLNNVIATATGSGQQHHGAAILFSTGVYITNSVLRATGQDTANTVAMNTGLEILNTDISYVISSSVEGYHQNAAGTQTGLMADTYGGWPGQILHVRNSDISGFDYAVRAYGDSYVYINGSTIGTGGTDVGLSSLLQCTGVTSDFSGTHSFITGPAPCP